MSGVHDLGGQEGFGPVDVAAAEFANEWERRQWALSELAAASGGTIDWWRHGIECMDPQAYLSLGYFEKWTLNEAAHYVDRGILTMDEVTRAKADQAGPAPEPKDLAAMLDMQRHFNKDFSVDLPSEPQFACGALVRTSTAPVTGHTRLPGYARGRTGTILAQRGGQLFPDAGARGQHVGHHLYTVEFSAQELWGEPGPDSVCIDLWEPYLEPA